MRNRVLFVDTRPSMVRRFKEFMTTAVATLDVAEDFATARTLLYSTSPDLLVTALRLGAHNGLHLVHLARLAESPPRSIVFSDPMDPYLAREARSCGAFYESGVQMPTTVLAYLTSRLPETDRRDAMIADRRSLFRGGRRSGDSPSQLSARPVMRVPPIRSDPKSR